MRQRGTFPASPVRRVFWLCGLGVANALHNIIKQPHVRNALVCCDLGVSWACMLCTAIRLGHEEMVALLLNPGAVADDFGGVRGPQRVLQAGERGSGRRFQQPSGCCCCWMNTSSGACQAVPVCGHPWVPCAAAGRG
jgi:hypothetical protein